MIAVICCHPKDYDTLPACVHGLIQNVKEVESIYIISKENPDVPGTHWVAEAQFPFSYDNIAPYTTPDRVGWYLQQLLKLYALSVIPAPVGLLVDADTVFLTPTAVTHNGTVCYAYGSEYHPPYFEHMQRMYPTLQRATSVSGICHHMVVEQTRLQELFALVETVHQKPFWRVFMDMTVVATPVAVPSGASEYEMYFHYVLRTCPGDYVVRPLRWKNSGHPECMATDQEEGWNYVSYHAYMR
jgi:Family of unknown function (DUF6492)